MHRATTNDGLLIWVNPNDVIGRAIHLYGFHEWTNQMAFSALLKPGDVVVDAGAHVGSYTLRAARDVGEGGRVIAVEPNDTIRALLDRNVAENGFANVEVLACALYDRDARMTLVPTPWSLNSGLTQVRDVPGPVSGRALDSLVAELEIPQVNAVKIDVEGATLQLLDGSVETIARDHPHLLVEVDEETWPAVSARLDAVGYEFLIAARSRRRVHLERRRAADVMLDRPRWEALNAFALSRDRLESASIDIREPPGA